MVLREHEADANAVDLCRKYEMSEATLYRMTLCSGRCVLFGEFGAVLDPPFGAAAFAQDDSPAMGQRLASTAPRSRISVSSPSPVLAPKLAVDERKPPVRTYTSTQTACCRWLRVQDYNYRSHGEVCSVKVVASP
jgi:hypothetical protein